MMPLLKNHVIVSWPLPNVAMSYLIVCWFGRELRASKTCQHKSSTARETQNLKLNQKKSQSPIVETENSLSLSLSLRSQGPMISQFFVLSQRGDNIVFRDCEPLSLSFLNFLHFTSPVSIS